MVRVDVVNNGYVLSEEYSDGLSLGTKKFEYVYQLDEQLAEDSKEHCETKQEMLYKVLELLGETSSKHDKYRIVIDVIKQND